MARPNTISANPYRFKQRTTPQAFPSPLISRDGFIMLLGDEAQNPVTLSRDGDDCCCGDSQCNACCGDQLTIGDCCYSHETTSVIGLFMKVRIENRDVELGPLDLSIDEITITQIGDSTFNDGTFGTRCNWLVPVTQASVVFNRNANGNTTKDCIASGEDTTFGVDAPSLFCSQRWKMPAFDGDADGDTTCISTCLGGEVFNQSSYHINGRNTPLANCAPQFGVPYCQGQGCVLNGVTVQCPQFPYEEGFYFDNDACNDFRQTEIDRASCRIVDRQSFITCTSSRRDRSEFYVWQVQIAGPENCVFRNGDCQCQ